jgi:hypothetical protein
LLGGGKIDRLVCRLTYNDDVAAGQLAVFQGVARRLRIDSDMRPPRALPTAHFERNDVTTICETVHEFAICDLLFAIHYNRPLSCLNAFYRG